MRTDFLIFDFSSPLIDMTRLPCLDEEERMASGRGEVLVGFGFDLPGADACVFISERNKF
jgi:hypothetical protein